MKLTIVVDASEQLRKLLEKLLEALNLCPSDQSSKHLTVAQVKTDSGLIIRGDIKAMQLKDNQKFKFAFGKPRDAKGNTTTVEAGSVKFSVTDGVSGHIEPNPDDPANPLAGQFVADSPNLDGEGNPQATTIHIEADADLGEGVKTISGDLEVLVTSGDAVGFGAPTVGTAEDQ